MLSFFSHQDLQLKTIFHILYWNWEPDMLRLLKIICDPTLKGIFKKDCLQYIFYSLKHLESQTEPTGTLVWSNFINSFLRFVTHVAFSET